MAKSCGCGGATGSSYSQPYVIALAGGGTKEFRSPEAANAYVAMTPGSSIVQAPPPAGG